MDDPQAIPVFSNSLIILLSLLCFLICVVGLMAVARCSSGICAGGRSSAAVSAAGLPVLHTGLKNKYIDSLHKFTYTDKLTAGGKSPAAADCAICLSEFVAGDEIRMLPHCNHAFHVACVDTWLRCHPTCPSCRRIIFPGGPPCRCGNVRTSDVAEPDFLP